MAYKTHLSAKDYTTGCLSNLNQQFNQTKSEIEKLVEFFHTTIEQQEWEINHLKSLLEISSESPKKIQELEKKHHKELADKDDIITSLSLVIQSIEDISLNNSISQPKRNDLKVEDFSDFSPTFSFNHFGSRS
ncbi:MAG: hypothetical protein JHC93_05890, partial [Parachlamydiales bacterium]|nr:hypothetical protein [Parachlamydiales bacterium]